MGNIGIPGLGLVFGYGPDALVGFAMTKLIPVPMPDPQLLLILNMITA